MDEERIKKTIANANLDKAVAEAMGWSEVRVNPVPPHNVWGRVSPDRIACVVPRFSSELSAAFSLVDHMRACGGEIVMYTDWPAAYTTVRRVECNHPKVFGEDVESLQRAICMCYLAAKGAKAP